MLMCLTSKDQPCAQEYAYCASDYRWQNSKDIPYRIGMAATEAKSLSLYGALRGGYLHALITDEIAARGILALFEQNFRKTP